MSGHNKWSQIKYKKAKEDAKKGKAFTRVAKEITIAAKAGGGDPDFNAPLRNFLEKARALNMPIENSIRAIKKGTGELPGVNYEAITYEGYGPSGIAIIVETLSDNRNRTIAELRHIFSSRGGRIAESGAVAWMFDRLGVIHTTATISEDELLETLLAYDIKDLKKEGNLFIIMSDPKAIDAIKSALKEKSLPVEHAEIEWIAQNPIALNEADTDQVVELLSELDDYDDVQNLYSSMA
jgi:YebC/PmpR family DNA-binding regulatory protein